MRHYMKYNYRLHRIILLVAFIIAFTVLPCLSANNSVYAATNSSSKVKQNQTLLDTSSIPKYSKNPSIEINNNTPYFTEAEKKKTTSFETYSKLDSLGRCGVAYANLSRELMPTEERGQIGMVKPSGWHTVKYNDLVDGNYLYNRCHLIGFQLAGENANVKNLITGTRYFNVQGMLPYEEEVAEYIKRTGNHVLYRVTPEYTNNNLVADGVLMEAYSVEDQGKGICFNVYCYNVQPGITIDYATGDSWRDNKKNSATSNTTIAVKEEATKPTAGAAYIANTNTKKFHYPICSSVSDMKEKNKLYYEGSRDGLINQGYVPCKRCNP